MMSSFRILLLFSLLLVGWFNPATAQTALIAHRSHSGSLATFDAVYASDNFGLPASRYVTDSVLRISDTLVLKHGRVYRFNRDKPERLIRDTLSYNVPPESPELTLEKLHAHYPNAKFIGFDSPPPTPPKQAKRKLKRSRLAPVISQPSDPPTGPTATHPIGVAAAALLLLAALGWGASAWRQASTQA